MAFFIGPGPRPYTLTVAAGTPKEVTSGNGDTLSGVTVTVVPGVGGTALCEYQTTPTDTYTAWPGGTVSARTTYVLTGPVYALKFTATTQPATIHLAT